MSKKSALDDLFARYTTAVGSLLQSLADLENCQWEVEVTEKALFDDKFTRWINSAKQAALHDSGLTCADTTCDNPHDMLKKVVMRLPSNLQAKWAEESSRQTSTGSSTSL